MEQIKLANLEASKESSSVTQNSAVLAKEENDKVIKKIPHESNIKIKIAFLVIVIIFAGVGSGRVLAGISDIGQFSSSDKTSKELKVDSKVDKKLFSDTAKGILRQGGINGEGTHYLDIGMGAEKNVYLFSTVLDLDSFVGKKVEVAGQTLAAEKAGWLMDVGSVKIIE